MSFLGMSLDVEMSPPRVGFILWAIVIGLFDWRQHRIPNSLLLLVFVPTALSLIIGSTGLLGADRMHSVSGLLIGLSLFFPGYVAGLTGAGDVKLSAVCGLLLGQDLMLEAGLLSALGLLVFAVVLLQRYGWAQARKMRFPAGVAIAAGFSIAILFPNAFS